MEQSLAGRTALITGSTSGIGHGIALLYAQAGAKVMLNGFGKPEEIARARAEIGAAMGVAEAPYSAADLSKPEAVRQMVKDAEAALGSVDILVNNAGIQFVAPVDEFPDDNRRHHRHQFRVQFHAIKAALPGMKARNWGRIVNIASAHGLVASPQKVAYVSAKHAVVGMTKTVALEVAKLPITCNAICPGFVRTPLAEAQVGPLAKAHNVSEQAALEDLLLEKQPSKRWIEVDEVARMALYLVGPGSGGVNGAALSIDGGWLAA
ncbi:3-hydroxybutyrate dehydrogenase [Paeniroseomonas aquatica]|uniref:3-hydroxybutyrate dehydrogenase n=1 Tax=Paeniroseomonas aquatica TaxID=373043 RepID=UPI00360C5F97